MQQTKEQLLVELTKIRQSHADWVSGDERRRKEFALTFNWYKTRGQFGYTETENEIRLPSWEEIFVQTGKLLSVKSFYNFDGTISELECAVEDIRKQLIEKNKPKQ